jgi:hypothetical protein
VRIELQAQPAERAAERAARDEARHARDMSRLAARHGVAARLPRIGERPVRALEAIALENVVEGCVRETYGALVALFQAETSRDPDVRRAMQRIAGDESRHAALSWRVARWIEPRLDSAGRARVAKARRRAVRQLRGELAHDAPIALRELVGLPSAARARELLDALDHALGLTDAHR